MEAELPDDPSGLHVAVDPTEAEVDAWAVRERHRREQWARGPTPEQTALWTVRERERRSIEQQPGLGRRSFAPGRPLWRGVQLASIGALRLAVNTSLKDAVDYLVQAGLDWEEQISRRGGSRTGRT